MHIITSIVTYKQIRWAQIIRIIIKKYIKEVQYNYKESIITVYKSTVITCKQV